VFERFEKARVAALVLVFPRRRHRAALGHSAETAHTLPGTELLRVRKNNGMSLLVHGPMR